MSLGGAVISALLAVPPTILGGLAKAADWTKTDFGHAPGDEANGGSPDELGLVLPLTLYYLTPKAVAILGLAAISAAVMSSTDSAMLSAGSLVARNIYKDVFRPRAGDTEVLVVMCLAIVINTCISTALAIHYYSIYGLM